MQQQTAVRFHDSNISDWEMGQPGKSSDVKTFLWPDRLMYMYFSDWAWILRHFCKQSHMLFTSGYWRMRVG